MHKFLTKHVVTPLSHLRRRHTSGMRSTYDNFITGLSFRRKTRDWGEERRSEWILEQLRTKLRAAAVDVPYYRTLFNKIGFDPNAEFSFDDFARLPVLQRDDIHNAGPELRSTSVSPDDVTADSTGGSTGIPTTIYVGPEERGWSESGMQFSFEKIGVDVGARKALLWGHHLDPQAPENLRDSIRSYLTNERVFDCFRMSEETMLAYHRQFQVFKPDCIVAYASALGHFAEFLTERKLTPVNYPNTCFVTGAEKLYPRFRTMIEDAFGTSRPVHERYGGRDFGLVAIQTNPASSLSFEVDWAWALLEPETDSEQSPLLVTKLHADAMPLIRYKVGDVCRLPSNSRPGHPSFFIEEVSGRELDRIWRKDGSWIAGEQFPHLLKSFPVREFMLIQDESYAVELQLVTKDGFNTEVENEISTIVGANLAGLPFRIRTVQTVERTMANKWRPVVSKVRSMV